MKKMCLALSILLILGCLLFTGALFAAEGTLVDKNSNPDESNVIKLYANVLKYGIVLV